MADGDDVPYFFREIMAMITTITEEEWGSSKDPSVKTKDETLRNYAKRGLSKKLAQTIAYRLTPEILIKRINERNKTQRSLMADDLRGYDAAIDADNVGEKVAAWMVEIIQTTAGLVKQDELEKQKQQKQAAELKISSESTCLQNQQDFVLTAEENSLFQGWPNREGKGI